MYIHFDQIKKCHDGGLGHSCLIVILTIIILCNILNVDHDNIDGVRKKKYIKMFTNTNGVLVGENLVMPKTYFGVC